jgi:hypothetical protein
MMPYDNYRLYQTERPKSAAEIRHADDVTGRLAAAASGLFRSITRPGRVARSYRRELRSCAAQCTAEPLPLRTTSAPRSSRSPA